MATDDTAALKHHGVVTFLVLLAELAAKVLVKVGVDFDLIPSGYGTVLQETMSLFLVFAVVIFSVTTIVLLVRNAVSIMRGKPPGESLSGEPEKKAALATTGTTKSDQAPPAASGGPERGGAA